MTKFYQIEKNGLIELAPGVSESLKSNSVYSDDLKPVAIGERTWNYYHIATLWIGMSVCVPTYTLASGLIASGMNWWQAVITIFLGNMIVLMPMVLIAFAGTKYGIAYPIFCRASFGVNGAHLPSLLRAGVACGWFGIQSWIGGEFLFSALTGIIPSLALYPNFKFVTFILFWTINVYIGYKGTESIKWMESYGAPILIGVGFVVIAWAVYAAGSVSTLLSATDRIAAVPGTLKTSFAALFLPSLNGMIAFWATIALNIPDFTRYARSQKDQITGQILGLPTTMAFYAFVGVFGTLGSIIVFNRAIWNPAELIDAFHSPLLSLFGGLVIFLATITTNIAANVVAPANAFANLMPKKITYRAGVIITGIIGILIMPWKLYSDPSGYIFNWLGVYGSFLGPLAGLYISDYYILRKQKLNLYDLYLDKSQYYNYIGGFNPAALITYFISIFPFCLDLLYNTFNGHVVNSSWIIGLLISFMVYPIFSKKDASNFGGFDSVTDRQAL
ncbi:MAG: hypothetical protein A2008_10205 [Candidatus Wallbacteria bacterium GWC2_49_35]|uniref:Nitrate reductase n=1 Tax=Candidatus Wallbacteria bacterium GWC2_49_35 TaxID=1817813 RepID=A0A1F7X0S5_9BACT|nr:MAG: hypothetical protein A2008_10205 [Candidatus Wallbacteria bacterium GWC2_49_35]HBC76343.1 nitrate reductase [Candidatus Wallbacteria bacterium]